MTANLDGARQRLVEQAVEKLGRAADLTVERTQAATSRREGILAASISHTPVGVASPRLLCEITAAAEHARYQDEGTGIYGPKGARIFPRKPGGVLVFDWPAAGGVVFARSVAGAPGRHFFREPMPERFHAACADVWAQA